MKYYLLITLLFLFFQTSAQSVNEFGEISQEEIEMTQYDQDPEAEAIILFDVGKSKFIDSDGGYTIQFTRHKRIKILEKSGTKYGEVSIPYYVDGYGKTEEVTSIKAFTYNSVNGSLKKQALNPSTIYEEKINQRWRQKKFVFPNVQEGSILEYEYVLETPFHFNLPDWRFQDKIPTLYSKYEVRMIPFYEYVFLVQGISKFDYQNSEIDKRKRTWGSVNEVYGKNVGSGVAFTDYIHTYVLKDIPAFKDESYISSINDYIIKMDFQLAKFHSPSGGTTEIISTWEKLNDGLLKEEKFGKYIKSASKYAKKIIKDELSLDGLSEKQKSIKMIEYTKDNFNWNGFSGKYASQNAKSFVSRKTGNSADINLFLIALLQSAEIEVYPVVLSTRSHGKIKFDYPFDHFTNYVIPIIYNESIFLTDATEDLLAYNQLPPRCFNEKGLMVSKSEEVKWVELKNNASSIERKLLNLSIDPEALEVKFDLSIQATNYAAFAYREKFADNLQSISNHFGKTLGNIDSVKTLGYNNPSRPYITMLKGTAEIEEIGGNLIINPFMNLTTAENKLTQKKRSYAVDFIYPSNETYEIAIEIPSGYQVSELPEQLSIENELANIQLSFTKSDEILKIKGNYHFKKSIYVSNEYARIKYYLDTIVKNFNEKIVLEKSEEKEAD